MPISTHILDTSLGLPVAGVAVSLARLEGGQWQPLQTAFTDGDGRCRDLLPPGYEVTPGVFRLHFETAAYFTRIGARGLYPFVEVAFEVRAGQSHYHIPLLLTPNSYTTYRGS